MTKTIKFARPKEYMMYKFGFEARCNEKKRVEVVIPVDDFKQHWVEK